MEPDNFYPGELWINLVTRRRNIPRINTPNVAIQDSRKHYRTFLLIQTHVLWSLWVKRRDFTARDKEKTDPAGTPGGLQFTNFTSQSFRWNYASDSRLVCTPRFSKHVNQPAWFFNDHLTLTSLVPFWFAITCHTSSLGQYLSAEAGIMSLDRNHAIFDQFTNLPIIEFSAESPVFIFYIHTCKKFPSRPIKIESWWALQESWITFYM